MSDDDFDNSERYIRHSDELRLKLLRGDETRVKGKKSAHFPPRAHYDQNCCAAELVRVTATLARASKERDFSIYILNTLTASILDTYSSRQRLPSWEQRRLTNEKVKATFYHLSLSFDHDNNLVPFVFNLSGPLAESLQSVQGNEISYVYDRLQDSLQEHLNIKQRPQLWMSLELGVKIGSKQGRYHIQGGIVFSPKHEEKIKRAFHAINGKTDPDFKKFALMLLNKDHYRGSKIIKGRPTRIKEYGRLAADLGWPLYNTKEQTAIKLDFDVGTNLIAADNLTKQRAKKLYKQWRDSTNEYYKTKK